MKYFSEKLPDDCVLLLFGCKSIEKDTSNIKFYGFTRNRDELAELYSMADVLVNCSREDTLSSLNLECQACGTPVVTYDATGSKETVDGINGYAVETGNYNELFAKLMYVYTKGKMHFSKGCRCFIEKEFEKETNYKKYISFFKNLLKE